MDEGIGAGPLAMIAVLCAVGVLAICGGFVLDRAADYKVAAAEQAWAHAAQVNAQANLVDARSAQIGMVATAMSGFVVPMIAMLIVAALVAGVFFYVNRQNERRHQEMLQQQMAWRRQSGMVTYNGETELYVPHAHTRAGQFERAVTEYKG